MYKILITASLCLFVISGFAQVSGNVKAYNSEKGLSPIVGASVHWANTTLGVQTDAAGKFNLDTTPESHLLVVSFVGYANDTIHPQTDKALNIILKAGIEIEEVIVDGNLGGEFHSENTIAARTVITSDGLNKLPCCNLAESFENNASVDVSYADAVSGARQIKMLGLAGIYSQILRENIPSVRGLSANYGMAYIPGSWMQSVQISKGSSSVKNGYESITGQINVEYKKPEKTDKLFVNLYGNHDGNTEINITTGTKLNEKVSSMILVHASNKSDLHDANNDSFAEMPAGKNINFVNRWKFKSDNNFESQVGINVMYDDRFAGQLPSENISNIFAIDLNTRKAEAYAKMGLSIPGTKHGSIGSMFSSSYYEHNSQFGNKTYSGIQKSLYANIIYETILNNTNHKLSSGFSFMYDDFDEMYNNENFDRIESVPGIFTQYTYTFLNKFSFIAGIRADLHNKYGIFYTPRVHARYKLSKGLTIRASAGKGYRTANILSENASIFASSRQLIIEDDLKQEEAWNYGTNATYKILYGIKKEVVFNVDFYRTDFINQIVTDLDVDAHQIYISNLNGKSYSNSFQAEVSGEPFKHFDVTAAFRYNDVMVTLNDKNLHEKPFVNKYKGLLSLSYATKFDKWKIDLTNQFNGKARIPDLSANSMAGNFEEYSPVYYILHAQITKRYRNWEFYAGGENILNFKQENPIIDPQNPFDENFDASMIWGPINGRVLFLGLRFTIE